MRACFVDFIIWLIILHNEYDFDYYENVPPVLA